MDNTMKKFIIPLLMTMVVLGIYAQEESPVDAKTTKKLTKQQKQELRRIEEAESAKLVNMMVETQRFVLEADYLSDRTGQRVFVSNTINFIAVDSNKITIQLATVSGVGGVNGMGGITADGNITSFEVDKSGKNQDAYSIHIIAMTRIGTFDVFIDVLPSANADASVRGNTGGKLNYHGRLVPLNTSKVFKGMAI
jgi:hypothetical protein